jgi:asparagine synthase (glutamine-hydrolysing)
MCGIVGYVSKNNSKDFSGDLVEAIFALRGRGPDFQSTKQVSHNVGLGHARLSIIDTSNVANQPMQDAEGRYTIVFNGEIFNFRELKSRFLKHVTFSSESDTEVLLNMYIEFGQECLQYLNGFFAFAIHDKATNEIFIARDRFGIKPLHIYEDSEVILFGSEVKALFKFPIRKALDYSSLLLYLQLNYLPKEFSMLHGIRKLPPGHFVRIHNQRISTPQAYYQIPVSSGTIISHNTNDYKSATQKLKELIEDSVNRRLVSDVPLGCFLSGGIDSSIVTACATKHIKNLNTFSIGYKDSPFYDETKYANMVAKRFGTNHTVFSIGTDDMLAHVFDMLNYIDEPFADSSSIAVYVLSKKTREKVTVALSGDGGDELFAGYNKHKAEASARNRSLLNTLAKSANPLLKHLPQSRASFTANKLRQIHRYSDGLLLTNAERYWCWCTFQSPSSAFGYLSVQSTSIFAEAELRRKEILKTISEKGDINDTLFTDMQLVLPGDMLTKVDLMSMANSLEVRVPFLDYTVVDFAFSLPANYKLFQGNGKRILKDAFSDVLPNELFTRPKHGFEVPIAKWVKKELRSAIENDLLQDDFVQSQGIFSVTSVQKLKQKAFGNDQGDAPATLWGLFVFQHWYKKFFLQ